MTIEQDKRLVDLIRSKYRDDPTGLRAYMPDVADTLEEPQPVNGERKSPRGLSDDVRARHGVIVQEYIAKLENGALTRSDAITALEHYARLDTKGWLEYGGGHETRVALLLPLIGKTPEEFEADDTIMIGDDGRKIVTDRSIVRGVRLGLDENGNIVSISVNVVKVAEWAAMMSIVGIGGNRDSATDVAERHDDYLAEIDPHGRD